MTMGLKRKASFEDSPSSTPATSLPSSSQGSSVFHQHQLHAPSESPTNTWNVAGAPYFNSRTLKRFRDNRPSEETIHQRTLYKLYSAQKLQQQGVTSVESDQSADPDTSRYAHYSATGQPDFGPELRVELPAERNQRSLDTFFSGGTGRPSSTRSSSNSYPHATTVLQTPLPSSLYQLTEKAPTIIPPNPRTLPSTLTCEDCYAPLLTKSSGEEIDAEMLDVDAMGTLIDPEIDGGWQCAVCAKRVCDTCAVRGDYRVCLECAVPGGGRYAEHELVQKRWVGGIGWM